MKKRIAELQGIELDAAVAIAEGWVPPADPFIKEWIEDKQKFSSMDWRSLEGRMWLNSRSLQASWYHTPYAFSSNWGQGGPIIERDQIFLDPPQDVHKSMYDKDGNLTGVWESYENWHATVSARTRTWCKGPDDPACTIGHGRVGRGEGSTPLMAAMRAYVQSKFGEEIELPEFPVPEKV